MKPSTDLITPGILLKAFFMFQMMGTAAMAFLFCYAAAIQSQDVSPGATFTLRQCIDVALGRNVDVLKASYTQVIAGADLESEISRIAPKLTLSSDFTRSGPVQTYVFGPLSGPSLVSSGVSNYYSTGISMSENIISPVDWEGIKQSLYSRRATVQTSKQTDLNAIENVVEAFYNQIKLTKALDVAKSAVLQNEEQTALSRAMLSNGSLARADLLKTEVALLQSRSDLIAAENNLSSGARSLALLIGMPGLVLVDTAMAFPDTLTPFASAQFLVREAQNANPTLLSAQFTLGSLKAGLLSSWFALLPSVGLTGSYSYVDSVQFSSVKSWANNYAWSVGVQFNWTLFDGMFTEAQIRRAKNQLASAQADLDNARRSTENAVRQALASALAARKNLSIVVPLLSEAKETYMLTKEKFKLGGASTLDLLSSQVTFNQSAQQAANAVCDYRIAEARLNVAIGKM